MTEAMRKPTFSTVQKIRFGHTDPAGIVYYPHYFNLFNEVVEDFFDEWVGVPIEKFKEEYQVLYPLRHVECDFVAASRIGDRLVFSLSVTEFGRSSMTLEIVAQHEDEVRVRARLVHVFISTEEWTTVSPPPHVVARLRQAVEESRSGTGFG